VNYVAKHQRVAYKRHVRQCYNMPHLHNWDLNTACVFCYLLNNRLEIKIISDLSNFT